MTLTRVLTGLGAISHISRVWGLPWHNKCRVSRKRGCLQSSPFFLFSRINSSRLPSVVVCGGVYVGGAAGLEPASSLPILVIATSPECRKQGLCPAELRPETVRHSSSFLTTLR